jgi:Holliday junction resolvase
MKLTIHIIPTAQMRARHGVVNGFSRTYKDPKQAQREAGLMALLSPHQPDMPLEGPLLLGVRAYMPIPGSKSKKFKAEAAAGVIRPTTKPDLDNLIKFAKDCLTMMRFWGDDKQVVGYLPQTGKYYSDNPRWELEIIEFKEVPA